MSRLSAGSLVRVMYHLASEMLEECCSKVARVYEEAETDALPYLDFPVSHWPKIRTNNCPCTSRELKRHSRAVQVFPLAELFERLVGTPTSDLEPEKSLKIKQASTN